MAGMNTTYNGGGVQTTTEAGGLPALPGYGAAAMPNFFQIMAMRQEQEREARNRSSMEAADARRRQALEAQRNQPMPRTSFVSNVIGGPGYGVGGWRQAHEGEPGAVMGGAMSGPEPAGGGGGGGGMSAAGGQDDLLRAQRHALEFGRFQQESRNRGLGTSGKFFDQPAGG